MYLSIFALSNNKNNNRFDDEIQGTFANILNNI